MTADFGRVGVLYGGKSAEREVSLMSGQGVHDALRSMGVDAHLFDMGEKGLADLAQAGFDRVFIALHGRFGEDGTLQGALEWLGIPYTGSGVMASSLAMDKIMTKRVWQHVGLPTPDFVELTDASGVAAAVERLGVPMIMKPPHEGSTVGVVRVDQADQALAAFQTAMHYDTVVLAEQFIRGRELTVPIIGTGEQARALPVIDIVAPQGNYDFEHKYYSDETQYFCPADLSPELTAQVQNLAVRAFQALGCEGWARADFMLDEQNRPWLLEMNTSPGMTSHSLVPMAAKAQGVSYAQLCVNILATARCKVQAIARSV
ncbi:MAG TPA: D-alanine--D-alanine ligase [Alcaligenes sp.]|nr:D-alanine--D-alanine ligase [Alcaligenes sp.]HRL28168.1 D-alanine--D-alanine ligase [Alcaligenes sp.]